MDEKSLNKIICKNIKKYRLKNIKNGNKITQKKLAEYLNISISSIRDIEHNKKEINIKELYKISIILKTSIDKFFK